MATKPRLKHTEPNPSTQTPERQVEQELKQRNKELVALLNVSRRLTGRLDLDELWAAIAQAVVDTLPTADAASLWLADAAGSQMKACAWAGHADTAFKDLHVSTDTSLVGLVYRTRRPQLIDDTRSEPAFEHLGRPALDAVRSVLGVPLLVDERPLGVLFADNFSRPQAFGDNEARLLQSLANQAAAAIQQAQLFDQILREIEARRRLEREVLRISDEEQSRIGRDLHDVLGSHLTGATMLAQCLALDAEAGQPASPEALREVARLVRQGAEQARALARGLNPVSLERLGLEAALHELAAAVPTSAAPVCTFEAGHALPNLDLEVATQLYRIAQEALNNAVKHAQARQIGLRLEHQDAALVLTVSDDGVGLPEAPAPEASGMGHAVMDYRAKLIGGTLAVASRPGHGTTIQCILPLPVPQSSSPPRAG